MSYVRVGIIWKHRFHVVDVHGGNLRIDVLKDTDRPSWIVRDRIKRGFPTIKSDRDKELFFRRFFLDENYIHFLPIAS